jgi:hypothetical protein
VAAGKSGAAGNKTGDRRRRVDGEPEMKQQAHPPQRPDRRRCLWALVPGLRLLGRGVLDLSMAHGGYGSPCWLAPPPQTKSDLINHGSHPPDKVRNYPPCSSG